MEDCEQKLAECWEKINSLNAIKSIQERKLIGIENKISKLPEILYNQLDGHKGQARRISIQYISSIFTHE